ncbi:MAG: IS1182 family transposase [Methanobrevibacter arboriphilus]|nr:IS1182 family transposase [Methanobrevibacter arboriphilus]
MVLRDDSIDQRLLVPLDLCDLIPEDHPCYLILNVVNLIDFKDIDDKYRFTAGGHAYSRKMLLRLVLMGSFDGGLSGRELERRSRTDVSYMYLAGMQKPDFRTINRFKVEEKELITEAFKKTILIAKKKDLIKINHIAIDGTKIKAKASRNNITDKEQLKILKDILEKSIELDKEEDELLGDESGNSIPKDLINKKSFIKIYEELEKEISESKNNYKLKSSSKKLLKKADKNKKSKEKVLKKINHLKDELEKTNQKVISINDPETRWMLNKKNQWEFDYNLQLSADDYKGILLSVGISNNPTDFNQLIPTLEQIKENIGEIPENTQISADNGYSTDLNMEYLEENKLDGYISSRKLSRKLKSYNKKDNPYSKDNFIFNREKNTYICPEGQILDKKGTYQNGLKTVYWTNKCKNCNKKEKCTGKYRYRTITDYGNPAKIRMQRKMEEKWAQKIYKKRSKTIEWPFGNIKRNQRINEFNTTGIERTQTEATLLAISHNLKRIYNETNKNT